MKKYKTTIPKSYYNIITLLLILLLLFSASTLLSKKNPSSKNSSENHAREAAGEVLNLNTSSKVDSNFFIRVVQHTFPNKTVQKQYKPILSVKTKGKTLFTDIFKIDFSNPLTFIQAQFPAVVAHHDVLVGNMGENNNGQDEDDWTKEIHFVDYDEEDKTRPVDNSITVDGEGELDKNIVDSLNPLDIENLSNLQAPEPIKLDRDRPSILIYHTHGTESYKPINEGNYHTLKKEYTVIAAADIISKELSKKGYNVIHDSTYHDHPSYNGSYGRSAVTAKSILEDNPSIKVILDIHRDGYDKIDTRADKVKLIENSRVKINNEYVARFQFVIGATSPNRKEVEKFAHFTKAVSDSKYPGFSKDVLVKQYGSYNQYLSDYSALIELGSNANTIEEAKKAGYYLADVIADTLNLLGE